MEFRIDLALLEHLLQALSLGLGCSPLPRYQPLRLRNGLLEIASRATQRTHLASYSLMGSFGNGTKSRQHKIPRGATTGDLLQLVEKG
jgi:hypothetical protein